MKKIICTVLAVITMCLYMVAPVSARNDVTVEINGKNVVFDQPPIIQNNRTLVPMRAIFEAMGCKVYWWSSDMSISVYKDDKCIMQLWVGRYSMQVGDEYVTLDVPPQILNDRTLVPVRAINESIGADVEWDGNTKTVSITYNQSQNSGTSCAHSNTRPVCMIDLRKFKNTGNSEEHTAIDVLEIYCQDCGEHLRTEERETQKEHKFSGNVCTDCGYEIKTASATPKPIATPEPATPETPSRPSSSNMISDYVNGAFMYITVPAGKSIEVPNTSNGSLKIQAEGVYNALERKSDGTLKIGEYNVKNRKGTVNISKGSDAVIENFGSYDLTVAIPSEYAMYSETNENVYATMYLSAGENAEISITGKGVYTCYKNSSEYDFIEYTPSKDSLDTAGRRALSYNYVSLHTNKTMIITARTQMEIYYCPAAISCTRTSQSAFTEVAVAAGETKRIHATQNSKTIVFTDEVHNYDAVVYSTEGKVVSQKQNKHDKSINVGKSGYVDFTNNSNETVTIKIPSVYCSVN